MKQSVVAGSLALSMLIGGGACATGSNNARSTALHAMTGRFTDRELADRAGAVVEGRILAKEIVPLAQDRDLPTQLSEGGRKLVDSGMTRIKWRVEVTRWAKGSGPRELVVVRGYAGPIQNGRRVVIAPQEDGQGVSLDQIAVGETYTFWLDPDSWFGRNYYVLAQAKSGGGYI
jgi:hypothetical protein